MQRAPRFSLKEPRKRNRARLIQIKMCRHAVHSYTRHTVHHDRSVDIRNLGRDGHAQSTHRIGPRFNLELNAIVFPRHLSVTLTRLYNGELATDPKIRFMT